MSPDLSSGKKGETPSLPLGILGGIFDPVHMGHLAIACFARDWLGLDKIYLIPSGTPPHKINTVSATPAQRLAMLRLAINGVKGLQVWDDEIRRRGISYTIDTIHRIRRENPRNPIYFIIGSDNLSEIATWYKYEQILSLVTLCVAKRPGHSLKIPATLSIKNILTFPSPPLTVSSTMMRTFLSDGYSCDYLIPPAVLRYIRKNGLYGCHGKTVMKAF